MAIAHDVEITAGLFHLRPWQPRDLTSLPGTVAGPDEDPIGPFRRFGAGERPAAEAAEAFLAAELAAAQDSAAASFAVLDIVTEEVLGRVTLHQIDTDQGSGQIGYWTAPHARGRGVATSATGPVIRWAFGALGLNRIELFHSIDNTTSCRIAEKLGFEHEATIRSGYRYVDGLRHDEHLHARLG